MHSLTKKLLQGLEELKLNPGSPVVSGVYKPVFDIFVHQTIGEIDLTQPQNIDKAKTLFEKLPSVSGKLEDLEGIYKTAQNHCDFGLHELRLDRNQGASELDLQKKGADLIAKSVTHVTIAANLPETHIDNPKIIQRLSGEIYAQKNLGENPNLATDLKTTINNVVRDSAAPVLENNVVENLVTKAVTNTVNKPGGGINSAVLAAASLLLTLLTQPPQELSDETSQQSEEGSETEEKTGTSGLGTALGAGYAFLSGRKTEEEEEENKKEEEEKKETTDVGQEEKPAEQESKPVSLPTPVTPAAQVVSPITTISSFRNIASSLRGISNNVGSLLKMGLGKFFKKAAGWLATALSGGTTKILGLFSKGAGKLLSFLGGFGGGLGQTDVGDSLKKAGIAIALIIVVPLLLIIGLSFFESAVLKPTALVTSTTSSGMGTNSSSFLDCQTGMGGGEGITGKTCPVNITPIVSPYPTAGTTLRNVPRGFPLSASCVTQPPRGSFTHQSLNAIDLGEIALFNSWEIRATHPGRVIWADWFGGYGMAVLLEDLDHRFVTYYGHILEGSVSPNVKVGNQVAEGTLLGIVDNNGFSTGDHLHYEIRGPRGSTSEDFWGSKTGEFGEIGSIINFVPDCKTWSCQSYCNK